MKHLFIALLVFALPMASMAQQKEAKKDSVNVQPTDVAIRFNQEALTILFNALSKSDYSHQQIEALKSYIIAEVKKQVPTTQK